MHEANINTKTSEVVKKDGSLPSNCIGSIDTPFGIQLINSGDALDHAYMRSKQLTSLLVLISGEGLATFRLLAQDRQDSILWLAQQLATETQEMFDIVVADEKGGQQ